jgi:hypothetical protein
MRKKYTLETFATNFKSIIADSFGIDASKAKYIISPVYDPKKSETGEDGAFRIIVLSEENIGGKKIGFDDTLSILTAFESRFPTKIEVSKVDAESSEIIEIRCSTRVRKPSAIANIESKYAPFVVKKETVQ